MKFNILRIVTVVFALALLGGCPRVVPQAAKSGKDATYKGAKKVKFNDEGEAKAKDIVTYPGGDRVDWKVFEITKPSDVAVTLRWRGPRPGTDLSMNIYDDTYHVVARAKPTKAKGGRIVTKTRKELNLSGAQPGKYYVQVYASERKDAGAYILELAATDAKGQKELASIPDPPKLAAIPKPLDPAAAAAAAAAAACPPGTPGCPEICPVPVPLGQPCPVPIGIVKAAKLAKGEITELSTSSGDVIVIINRGTKNGVQAKWQGVILRGQSDKPLSRAEYDVLITNASEDESVGRVLRLTLDQIGDNRRILLKEPPAEK